MKKKTFIAVLIQLAFAFFICLLCSNDVNASSPVKKNTATQFNIIDGTLNNYGDLYCPVSNAFSLPASPARTGAKNPFSFLQDTVSSKQDRFFLSLSVISYQGHLLESIRKNAIIYPFHYFW